MRLNLGAGGQCPEGWLNIDRAGDVDVIHDLTDLPLPFDDQSCGGAVAHHVLDLLPPDTIGPLLDDIHRVLALGALLRISMADLLAGIDAALRQETAWFAEPCATLEETVGWFVTQGGARKTLLLAPALRTLLHGVGFTETRTCKAGETIGPEWLTELDSRAGESVFVEAVK